jgi:hypothetical protein
MMNYFVDLNASFFTINAMRRTRNQEKYEELSYEEYKNIDENTDEKNIVCIMNEDGNIILAKQNK